jgi:hypothetical protein
MHTLEVLIAIKDQIDRLEILEQEIKQDKDFDPAFHAGIIRILQIARERGLNAIRDVGLEMFKEMGG